jgi:signal transduction histidine kinase
MAWAQPATAAPTEQRSVLILLPAQPGLPAASAFASGIRSTLTSGLSTRIAIETEHVDLASFRGPDGPQLLRNLYRSKYAGRPFDAIVVAADEPFRFLLRWRAELWPGIPVIVSALDERTLSGFTPPPRMTVITIRYDLEGTLRDALALLPETQHVALIGGTTAQDRFFREQTRLAVQAVDDRLDIIDLTGLTVAETLTRVAALPDRTIGLSLSFLADDVGHRLYATEIVGPLSAAANRPLFSVFGTVLGLGIVGGSLMDYEAIGREAGAYTLRLLRGEPMPASPVRSVVPSEPTFDSRQLQRWGLDEKRLPPGTRVLHREQPLWERYWLQIVGGVTLLAAQALLIAGLLIERARRRQVQAGLAERLRFEALLSEISLPLATLPAERVDEYIQSSLRQIGMFLDVDRATLWQLSADGQTLSPTHSWRASGIGPPPESIHLGRFPTLRALSEEKRILSIARLDELPPEAAAEAQALGEIGVRSCVIIPLTSAEHRLGVLMFANLREVRVWPEDSVDRLQVLGEPLASTVARRQSEDALATSTAFTSAVLSTLPGEIAIIDATGSIVQVNDAWAVFARSNGAASRSAMAPGANYLEACRRAIAVPEASAEKAATLIESVLQGRQNEGMLEYVRVLADRDHWFEMRGQRLKRPEGGAAVMHFDVTPRKRAEQAAQRHLGEMAHMDRVAAMGELTASLAHELNQPLAAILTNAEAAHLLLALTPPDLEEFHGCVDDIVKDAHRAGEVIRRIRRLLKKGALELLPFSLTTLAENVIALIANDALLHNVDIELQFAPAVAVAHGDSIQIQQVILNLLTNAISAAAERPAPGRRVSVWTSTGDDYVELGVRDSGRGIAEDERERLFEPFFTTKPDGLGMGLAISRSIVEAHGGRIWGENDPGGGAVFRVRFPTNLRKSP